RVCPAPEVAAAGGLRRYSAGRGGPQPAPARNRRGARRGHPAGPRARRPRRGHHERSHFLGRDQAELLHRTGGGLPMSIVKIGANDIYAEEHGEGDPLLMIMGLAADSTAWLYQVPDFARRYRTITFDNRGVGRSAKPAGPYSIHEMADDAAGLLDHLKISRAHVIGISMGG